MSSNGNNQPQSIHNNNSNSSRSSNGSSITIPGSDGRPVTISITGQSVGGSIYGTTPGGTKIKYSKSLLMHLSGSPVARTPPRGLPVIPGITKVNASDAKPQVEAVETAEVKDTDAEKSSAETAPAVGETSAAADNHDDGMVFEME